MADEEKAKGNAAFFSGDYYEAIFRFTDAIFLAPTNHILYSNRSAAYASLTHYASALVDAQKTVALKPDWGKGYSRLGGAHLGLGNPDDAVSAYKKGLEVDPTNEALKSGLADAQAAQAQSRRRPPSPPPQNLPERKMPKIDLKQKQAEAKGLEVDPTNEALKSGPAYAQAAQAQSRQRPPSLPPQNLPERKGPKIDLKQKAKGLEVDPTNEALKSGLAHAQAAQAQSRQRPPSPPPQNLPERKMPKIDLKQKQAEAKELEVDPTNEALKSGLAYAQAAQAQSRRRPPPPQTGPERKRPNIDLRQKQVEAMQDPDIQSILTDPVMRQALVDFQENPKAAQERHKNPKVMAKIKKLVSAGILRI